MKSLITYSLLFLCVVLKAQDKIYFLDGSCKTGKVTEISGDHITLEANETEIIGREKILLLEFKNGMVEIINQPSRAVIYNPNSSETKRPLPDTQTPFLSNIFSINTLALCNADISLFFERILPQKKIGIGVMGAYNFNQYASIQNFHLALLNNAKKNYDIGVFANYHTVGAFGTGTTFHWGVMIKYLNFKYSKAIEEKTVSGGVTSSNVKYTPATGSQLATIFTFGSNTPLSKNIYLKSIIGLGGFNLRGDYKQQYNYYLVKAAGSTGASSNINRSFLLKAYLGINIGYSF